MIAKGILYIFAAALAFGAGHIGVTDAARHTTIPSLSGVWAWEGTGPSGLVPHGPRLATLSVYQHGHALTGVLRTGNKNYPFQGTYYYPKSEITMRYSLKQSATVRFSGSLGQGSKRILGQWSDARGDDGGTILVKVAR